MVFTQSQVYNYGDLGISELFDLLDERKERISELEGTVEELEADVSNLEAKVAELEKELRSRNK